MTQAGESGRQCLPDHPCTQDSVSHSAISLGCRLSGQALPLTVKRTSTSSHPAANRTREVHNVTGVAGRDQIAVDHDRHVVAPEASVLLDDRADDQVRVLAGEMEPREIAALRDS